MSIEQPDANRKKLDESLDRLGELVAAKEARLARGEIVPHAEKSPEDIAYDAWSEAEAKADILGEGNSLTTIYDIARSYIASNNEAVKIALKELYEKRRSA